MTRSGGSELFVLGREGYYSNILYIEEKCKKNMDLKKAKRLRNSKSKLVHKHALEKSYKIFGHAGRKLMELVWSSLLATWGEMRHRKTHSEE